MLLAAGCFLWWLVHRSRYVTPGDSGCSLVHLVLCQSGNNRSLIAYNLMTVGNLSKNQKPNALNAQLSTSPWCILFFSLPNPRPHPCHWTSLILWSEPLSLSLQSHHNITLGWQTNFNLLSQRATFTTGRRRPVCLHDSALRHHFMLQRKLNTVQTRTYIDSHSLSKSLTLPQRRWHLPELSHCLPIAPYPHLYGNKKSFSAELFENLIT